MSSVFLDSDFLSSFLKIERLPLVREFYQAETLLVPPAVYREVAVTTLLPDLATMDWVKVETPESPQLIELSKNEDYSSLGAGEREAIALANRREGSILLMNDKKASQCAEQFDVRTVNVPAFLLACKHSGFTETKTIQELVTSLQERDHYGFRKETLDFLLK
ncbi:MAG: hypothetical protein GY856_28840 [bacterium]|nr:hypothetical protein [bacterium]